MTTSDLTTAAPIGSGRRKSQPLVQIEVKQLNQNDSKMATF